jgi:hypothetical protein
MRALAILLGLGCAFFVFYTLRLLLVTHLLQHVRTGGQGAYFGAAAFPVLALLLGWAGTACWRRAARK